MKNDYIPLNDICRELNNKVKTSVIKKMLKDFKPYLKIVNSRQILVIDRPDNMSELESIIQNIKANLIIKEIKDPIKRIEYLLQNFSDVEKYKYKFTIKTFKEFTIKYINSSNHSKLMQQVMSRYYTLCDMLSVMQRDINKLNQDELQNLFFSELKRCRWSVMSSYWSYLQENYKNEVNTEFKCTHYRENKLKSDEDFYTEKEWADYLGFLMDIDKHILNAFNNAVYARCWLFTLLHFSLAWRKMDILSIPALDNIVDADKYTLEWFQNNEFTQKDALHIISNTKLVTEQYFTRKTGVKLHFNIGMALIIPTAIVIVIVEQWRRKHKSDYLFENKELANKQIYRVLGNSIIGFSSIKANRTLLSLINDTTDKMNKQQAISHAGYMRSHKMNYYNYSDTTLTYLKSTFNPKDTILLSKVLFNKGAFGWLYDSVLAINNEQGQKNLQEKYEIEVLEQSSAFLLNESCRKDTVIQQLMNYSKEDLQVFLLGESQSRQDYIYCLNQKICPDKLNTNCLECKYSAPTIYSLYAISDEINRLLEKIQDLDATYLNDRTRYIYRLLKLISIIKDACNAFGDDIVSEFINLNAIMQSTKKLLKDVM